MVTGREKKSAYRGVLDLNRKKGLWDKKRWSCMREERNDGASSRTLGGDEL